ncbi:hypothetical protein A1F99_078780 [Pyrenophora tritici-repentis]|nr:hypothetical protein A1F99_078780 [Pyrenophora tritici-repentis]
MAYQGMGGGNGLRSPREETSFLSLNRAAQNQNQNQNGDGRATLHRRFTTNNIPTLSMPLSPIGQQRRQAAEPTEFTTAVCRHSHTSRSWKQVLVLKGALRFRFPHFPQPRA